MKLVRLLPVLLALLLLSTLSSLAGVSVNSDRDAPPLAQATRVVDINQNGISHAPDSDGTSRLVDASEIRLWGMNAELSGVTGSRVDRLPVVRVPGIGETDGLGLTKAADPMDGLRNDGTLTFTLTLTGPGLSVRLRDPLPSNVRYVAGSVTEPAVYNPTANAITWQGTLPTGAAQMISFQVTPVITHATVLSLSAPIFNTARLTDIDDDRTVSASVAVNALRQFLPVTLRGYSPDRLGWDIILADDFEGDWPGRWELSYEPGYAAYLWAKRDCRAYRGEHSAWAAGGNAGSSLTCGANYPENMMTYMVYGPFSLTDATAADLSFELWLQTADYADEVYWGAALNGEDFWGYFLSGSSNGWEERTFDLRSVYGLGNLMGRPKVWIVLAFVSDSIASMPEGVYVDDVVLRKTSSESAPTLWQVFSFTGVGIPAKGCRPADPAGGPCVHAPNSEPAPAPPWTFTAPTEGLTLTVVDGWASGDVFDVFDFGTWIGGTSASTAGASCWDPNECLLDPGMSSGEFPLAAGEHSITIVPSQSAYGAGAAFFRTD